MGDLISRKSLMDYTLNQKSKTIGCNDIARFPAVEAEPVRHGRWIWTESGQEDYEQYWVCSECTARMYFKENYCPNCGAKMDMEG